MEVRHTLWSICCVALLLALAPSALAEDSRVIVGEDVYVGPEETVDEVVCIGGTAHVEGTVDGDIVVIGGKLELLGVATGDTVVVAGEALIEGEPRGELVLVFTKGVFADDVRVGSDLIMVASEVEDVDAVQVAGSVERVGGSLNDAEWLGEMAFWGVIITLAILALLSILAGPLLVLLAYSLLGERRSIVLAETISQRPGMCFVIGLASCFAFSLLWSISALLGLSLLGIDSIFFIVMAVVLIIGYTGVSLWVGRGLVSSSPLAAALFGAILVSILQIIPLVGWLLMAVYVLLAVGSVALSGSGTSVDWLLRRTEAEPLRRSSSPPPTPVNTP